MKNEGDERADPFHAIQQKSLPGKIKKRDLLRRIDMLNECIQQLVDYATLTSTRLQAIENLLARNQATFADAARVGIREEIPF